MGEIKDWIIIYTPIFPQQHQEIEKTKLKVLGI
jgi:hypothetical protein